jgi:hypothetical protein
MIKICLENGIVFFRNVGKYEISWSRVSEESRFNLCFGTSLVSHPLICDERTAWPELASELYRPSDRRLRRSPLMSTKRSCDVIFSPSLPRHEDALKVFHIPCVSLHSGKKKPVFRKRHPC